MRPKTEISGEYVHLESGTGPVIAKVSGEIVQISGQHVFVESGVHVVGGGQSGQHVMISGQHVFVESGVQVVATVDISGQPVKISGEHVYVESGVYTASGVGVQVQSGVGVLVSGQHVFVESGVYLASGIYIAGGGATTSAEVHVMSGQITVDSGLHVIVESGLGVQIESGVGIIVQSGYGVILQSGLGGVSGQFVNALVSGTVVVASGVGVQIQSGAGVLISGQHIYVESGVFVTAKVSGDVRVPFVTSSYITVGGTDYSPFQQNAGGYLEVNIESASAGAVASLSGLFVLISGQHVFVESGVIVASGLGVVTQSGLGVLISGQHVYVESGVGVQIQSGAGVLVSGQSTAHHVEIDDGLILVSGTHQSVIALLHGYDIDGQEGWFRLMCDGNHWLHVHGMVSIESGSVSISSGTIRALISGDHVFVESGVYLASGVWLRSGSEVTVGITQLSGLRLISGQAIVVQSGLGVLISGQMVRIQSGTTIIVDAPSTVIAQASNNPMVVGALSGGVNLISATCVSVTVKALSINSGDIYVGGEAAGHSPYSGRGFLLEPGEAINIDVDNLGLVRSFAEVSGDRITYLAVNG